MVSIDKRKGNWRAQIRRGERSLTKTVRMEADSRANEIEWSIDINIDPTSRRITSKDSFALLIRPHIVGKLARTIRR
jgi:hypothetical protein